MVEAAVTGCRRDIIGLVKSRTRGDFQKGLLALLEPAPIRDAEWIHKSVSGFNLLTRKAMAREVLCTRTPAELRAIAGAYRFRYRGDMVDDVVGAFFGKERELFRRLLTVDRVLQADHAAAADRDRARTLAQALYEAGPARWGTDEGTYIQILTTESPDALRAVFREFEALYGQNLLAVMDKEFSGSFEKDMLTLSKFLIDPPRAFADIIRKALTGVRTDEEDLIRAIIARKDIDLREIMEVYEAQGGSLMEDVESKTRGEFRSLLMAVIASVA
ncbi:hypothetical protein CBR_g4459 [Chara braunii]|uniref:Annexin n=1 Tax=Chara braunii TaxID=69332 RepID=A0A388KHV9_CHABU|nr:hypothetical protein CBR_g4459 [Chara braunii]|eukprot:GBG69629.1 hypothetical protein CBR_g4459 [Chara braunii]